MIVALNTQTAAGQKSGFGWYASKLIEEMPHVAPDITYACITPGSTANHLSTPKRFLWDQIGFPRAANALKNIDLVHQPSFSATFIAGKPLIVSAHDIIPMLFPENFSLPSRMFFGRFMPFTYRAAAHILTISEHSKRDLIEHVHIAPEKITVTPLAASEAYHPLRGDETEKLRAARNEYGISEKYFIHVGTLEPRKNLLFLVHAFAEAKKTGKIPEHLVIVGKKGWGYESLYAAVTELGIADSVIFTGYVSDENVPLLMAGATSLVFPSLYEGFGLPPLEGMRCGTPAISSNTSSMPEVVGDTGILLSPTDQQAWATAMVTMSTDSKMRASLGTKAHLRAVEFTWEKTARQTAAVYEIVFEQSQRNKR
jgi:glycosyltransferase involved in cell wall biosynthesis